MSPRLHSHAQPLKSSWNMTGLWSRTPPHSSQRCSSPGSLKMTGSKRREMLQHCISNLLSCWQWCVCVCGWLGGGGGGWLRVGLSSLYFSCISPFILQKTHLIWCFVPLMPLKENNEDLQNAKRHMGVSLIAAVSYQSLKQIAHQLLGFVLDISTTLRRGDLSKIMRTEDDGMCLIHFKRKCTFSFKWKCGISVAIW